jgi:maltose O-acetyltransferase
VVNSPKYYSHYSYFEARNSATEILIGNNVSINNNCSIEAFSKIIIQDNVLIGINCVILDNDGHNLGVDKRLTGIPKSEEIVIQKNVFIGDNVTILKGVTIGENSVIGNGSIVTISIPANVIAVGNPAKIVKEI